MRAAAAAQPRAAVSPTAKREPRQMTARAAAALDYVLRFAIATKQSGRVEMLYFRHPKDAEGVKILLSPRERDDLVLALSGAGFHHIVRDDEPERQRELPMWKE